MQKTRSTHIWQNLVSFDLITTCKLVMEDIVALFVKLGIISILWLTLSWKMAVIVSVVVTVTYRHIIAYLLGLHAMDAMDLNTFATSKQATLNVVTMTIVSKSDESLAYECFGRLVRTHLKLRCKLVQVLGDLYYREMPFEIGRAHV